LVAMDTAFSSYMFCCQHYIFVTQIFIYLGMVEIS